MQYVTATADLESRSPELMSRFHNAEPERRKRSPEGLSLLAVAAHDLRNPVSAIIALAEILTDGAGTGLSPLGRELVADLLHAGEVTLKLIDSLLDVSVRPIEEMRLPKVDMGIIVDESMRVNRALSRRRGLHLLKRSSRHVPPVRADFAKLLRVISELISNAMEASERGQSIEIRVRNRGSSVEVTVQDQGAGIAPENLSRLFVPTPMSEPHLGDGRRRGIGLAIVHEIVESHRGHMRVATKVGVGSAFVVSLPVAV
jgi:signal transduction histidine kinase